MTFYRTVASLVAIGISYVTYQFLFANKEMHSRLRKLMPVLGSASHHKGQHGRVMVVGGSLEYTGAPYYAGISALRMGAELVYVLCHPLAAIPIKSYSPELMVIPKLKDDLSPTDFIQATELEPIIKRLSCLVAGPGLGRNPKTLANVREVFLTAAQHNIPMVLDGDALWLLAQKENIYMFTENSYSNVILTPNAMEFRRLWLAAFDDDPPPFDVPESLMADNEKWFKGETGISAIDDTMKLARALGGLTILRKGYVDVITDGTDSILSGSFGAPRRCGGQGDLLAGTVGVWYGWSKNAIMSAYGGSLIVRHTAQEAFSENKRSTLVTDMIAKLPTTLDAFERSKL